MNLNKVTLATAVLVAMMSLASASFAIGTPVSSKGNNGWGNGGDPINAGSGSGRTSPTKLNSALR